MCTAVINIFQGIILDMPFKYFCIRNLFPNLKDHVEKISMDFQFGESCLFVVFVHFLEVTDELRIVE